MYAPVRGVLPVSGTHFTEAAQVMIYFDGICLFLAIGGCTYLVFLLLPY